jgi:hypothetical protein
VTEGSYALLPGPGLYHVELEVEHMDTGAVRSTTAQIPVALPAGDKPDGRYAFVG